jgi:hypothetical protein
MEKRNLTKLMFDLSPDQVEFETVLNSDFLKIGIKAVSDVYPNRNGSAFSKESLKAAIPTFYNKPIMAMLGFSGDFDTHNGRDTVDPENGAQYWDTTNGERIIGIIRESDSVSVVQEGGLDWIKVSAAIYVQYAYKEIKRLLSDRTKKVSVEVSVEDAEKDANGVLVIKKFSLQGITILGDMVPEAIPGAVLQVQDQEQTPEQTEVVNKIRERQMHALTLQYAKLEGAGTEGEKGMDIKLDKTKEAMSDTPWGDVDKAELRKKVAEASNFKSVAKSIFMQLEKGWEDGTASKLKYPVMQLKGDVAVYNRGALAAAKGYADKNGETKVSARVAAIYKMLGLDKEDAKESAKFEAVPFAELDKCCGDLYCKMADGCECDDDYPDDDDDDGEGEGDGKCAAKPQNAGDKHDEGVGGDAGADTKPGGDKAAEGKDGKCAAELEMDQKCAAKDKEIADLKAACGEKDKEIESLKAKCAESDAKCAEADKKCAAADVKCADFEQKCAALDADNKKYRAKELSSMAQAYFEKYSAIPAAKKTEILTKCSACAYADEKGLQNDIALAAFDPAIGASSGRSAYYSAPVVGAGSAAVPADGESLSERLKKFAESK